MKSASSAATAAVTPAVEALPSGDRLLTRKQLQALIPRSSATLWRWARAGILKPRVINGRPLYSEAEARALVANGEAGAQG